MATTISYEKTTCSRCGGTGTYSYCQMWGTTCFGCKGKRIVTSARGRIAANAFDAERLAVSGRLIDTVQVGDRVLIDNRFRTVEAVQTEGGSRFLRDGVWVDYVAVQFTKKLQSGPEVNRHGFLPGTRVVFADSTEQWAQLVAFADTLPGALLDGQPSAATVKADARKAKAAATRAANKAKQAAQARTVEDAQGERYPMEGEVVAPVGRQCGHCGGVQPVGQSCDCFDNGCQ